MTPFFFPMKTISSPFGVHMEAGTNVGAMPKSASWPGVPGQTAAFRGKAINPQAVVYESRGDTTRDHLMAPISRSKVMTASWRTPSGRHVELVVVTLASVSVKQDSYSGGTE